MARVHASRAFIATHSPLEEAPLLVHLGFMFVYEVLVISIRER